MLWTYLLLFFNARGKWRKPYKPKQAKHLVCVWFETPKWIGLVWFGLVYGINQTEPECIPLLNIALLDYN